jgi:hypothetical protein
MNKSTGKQIGAGFNFPLWVYSLEKFRVHAKLTANSFNDYGFVNVF